MALTELVNGTKLPKQVISTALGVSRLHDALWRGYRHFYEELRILTTTMTIPTLIFQ
ncbi:hypothetical protein PS420_02205 [Pediococcus acidilactici]